MKTIILCLVILVSCNDKSDESGSKFTPAMRSSEPAKESELEGTPQATSPQTPRQGSNPVQTQPPQPPKSNPPAPTPPAPNPTNTSVPAFTQEFMKLINNHRASMGLQALTLDARLTKIAQGHSDDMADLRTPVDHVGFSNRCAEAYSMFKGGNTCGENVAGGYQTAKSVFDGWMNSPGHRRNIEQGRYSHTGLAFTQGRNGWYYWTNLFLEY